MTGIFRRVRNRILKRTTGMKKKTVPRLPSNETQLHIRETKRKSLIYTPEGKAFIQAHPGIIRDFLTARREILKGKEEVKKGKITVEWYHAEGDVHSILYKIRIGGRSFFIKEQREGFQGREFVPRLDLAKRQIMALHAARRLLRNIPGVEVANYHLAWTSGENSFLITDFYYGENCKKLMRDSTSIYEGIVPRIRKIRGILRGKLGDVKDYNMIYLPETDTIIVFDLRELTQ
ncbi:MAG: hypothetical protein V1776_04980 [Candidatus Diapherotrites archaeon]